MSELQVEVRPGGLALYERQDDGKSKFLDIGATPSLQDAIEWLQARGLEVDKEALDKAMRRVMEGESDA